jgi:hypothetical protein
VKIPRDHSGSVGSHDFRGDFIILSHSLDLKEEIETSLTPTMFLCRPGQLNNPDMSIKCSNPEITQDQYDRRILEAIFSHYLIHWA